MRGISSRQGRGRRGRGRGCGRGRRRGRGRGRATARGSGTVDDDLQWSETSTVNVEPFTESVGPISARIIDIFKLFFTTTLVDLVVEQTNLYASQVMDTSRYEKWSKVTADEIWAYFGFMILMGINHLPALAD